MLWLLTPYNPGKEHALSFTILSPNSRRDIREAPFLQKMRYNYFRNMNAMFDIVA